MIYIKSLLAGVGAMIACYFLIVTVVIRLLVRMPFDQPEGAGYVSSSPWVPLWPVLLILPLVFAAACFWTFKKLSKAGRRRF